MASKNEVNEILIGKVLHLLTSGQTDKKEEVSLPTEKTETPLIEEVFFETIKSPILPGWIVAYRVNDRLEVGKVTDSRLINEGWAFRIDTGETVFDNQIVSVGKFEDGVQVAAWTVRDWGLDGNRQVWPKR